MIEKKLFLNATLVGCILLACLCGCRANSGQEQPVAGVQVVGPKMTALMKEHRYQDAVDVGLRGLQHNSKDDLIYFFIAEAYEVWATQEPARKSELLKLAADYAQKSVSTDPEDYGNDVGNASVLEYIGDHDDVNRCSDYKSSKALLDAALIGLRSDTFKAGSYDEASAPVRSEVLSLQSEIASKLTQANCK